ncbi:MAG: glycosyl transferase [Robiginitomaculum sp.]|nr:MAG: glycosyl transferase [Robiginitomaculum sp.]
MSISAIIVSYKTGPALKECVRAVQAENLIDDLIIVDNGNEAQTIAWMDGAVEGNAAISLVRGQGNVGFARACNLGAKATKGEVFLFLNPDAVLQESTTALLAERLKAARPGSIIGARLLNRDGSEQRGARRGRLTPWSALVSMTGLSRFAPVHPVFSDMHQEDQPVPNAPISVHAISGACMMIRRDDYLRLGGFDERYFLHVEDLDLCRRVRKAGGDVIFVPGAEVLHYGSTSKSNRLVVDWHKATGLVRYFYKFAHSPLEKLGALILALPIIGAVMLRSLALSLKERLG